MAETILDLGRKVKAAYPGEYDDIPDVEVGRRVKAKYPEYGDFADVAGPTQGSKTERPGFMGRAWDASIGGLVGVGGQVKDRFLSNPNHIQGSTAARAVDAVAAPALEMGSAIKDRFLKNPNDIQGSIAARGVDAIFGPTADLIADDVKAGNDGGALGTVAGNILTLGIPAILKRLKGGTAAKAAGVAEATKAAEAAAPVESVTSSFKPGTMESAVQYADQNYIPVTRGERSGSKVFQAAERAAEVTPGASDVATEFYNMRNEALKAKPAGVVNRMGGAAIDSEGNLDKSLAGEAVEGRFKGRAQQLNDFYSQKYDSIQKAVNRNTAKLQEAADATYEAEVNSIEKRNRIKIADEQTRNQLLSERGADPSKLPQTVELEAIPKRPERVTPAAREMAPVKARLQGLYDELSRNMTTTEKESSPGYTRLKAVIEDPTPVRSALDIDKDLSEIKSVLRSESEGYTPTKSGRYAIGVIKELEKEVQGAILDAGGPKALDDLLKARSGVKEMHRSFEALEAVLPKNQSPVVAYENLVRQGDRNIKKAIEIQKRAPEASKEIAATYLEGALRRMTGEGGQADMTAAANDWKRMGPRTKQLYFGKHVPELNSFFENAPQLIRNVNKSGSAYMLQGAKLLNYGGMILGAVTHGPEAAAGALAGTAAITGGAMLSANQMAKFLFKPGNARLVENALRYANEPKIQNVYLKKLTAAVESDPGTLEALQAVRTARQAQQSNPPE